MDGLLTENMNSIFPWDWDVEWFLFCRPRRAKVC
jgi:hypothetical protein